MLFPNPSSRSISGFEPSLKNDPGDGCRKRSGLGRFGWRGRRPSFSAAAPPEVAAPLVDRFAALLASQGVPTRTGVFGAHMLVDLENDGPVTIWLEK